MASHWSLAWSSNSLPWRVRPCLTWSLFRPVPHGIQHAFQLNCISAHPIHWAFAHLSNFVHTLSSTWNTFPGILIWQTSTFHRRSRFIYPPGIWVPLMCQALEQEFDTESQTQHTMSLPSRNLHYYGGETKQFTAKNIIFKGYDDIFFQEIFLELLCFPLFLSATCCHKTVFFSS